MSQDVSVFFFQKAPKKNQKIRYVYFRISVNGIPKEASTKRKWPADRWDQKSMRAIGTKEDAKSLNAFLESKEIAIYQARETLIREGHPVTAEDYSL